MHYEKNIQDMFPELHHVDVVLEYPREKSYGDLAIPCFGLARHLKQSPHSIAQAIVDTCVHPESVQKAQAVAGYINLQLNPKFSVTEIQRMAIPQNTSQKVSIEFSSPNTNKPLHIGHLRNIALGETLSALFEAVGATVVKTEVVNDRGIAIAKMMLIYEKFHQNTVPSGKSDHFAGDLYVEFEQKCALEPELEQEAQEILKKWEEGDPYWYGIWNKLRDWVVQGQQQTYQMLRTSFDERIFESDIFQEGKDIVLKGYQEGFLYKDSEHGYIYANLEEAKLPNKILLRSNGTALYITQDLALLKKRLRGDSLCADSDVMIYITAYEQNLQFAQLFAIAEQLGITDSRLSHVGYGAIRLPEGKMSSRKGNVIHIDTLIEEIEHIVRSEYFKNTELSSIEEGRRVRIIARAAYWYYVLAPSAKKDMIFDKTSAVSITGKTGPYILYTYARLRSVLRKSRLKPDFEEGYDFGEERELIGHLIQYPEIIQAALRELDPALLAQYLYELAELSNAYYHRVIIIGKPYESSRLLVIEAICHIIQSGLTLLKIETLEEM